MIEVALKLFQKQGYSETSWRELVKEAGTPWGSAHHFFPGGKEELAAAALGLFQDNLRTLFEQICQQYTEPADRVRACFNLAAQDMEQTNFMYGCPMAGVALNTVPKSTALSLVCHEALDFWKSLLVEKILGDAFEPDIASSLATLVMLTFEGALVLARVQHSSQSLILAADHLAKFLEPSLKQKV